MQPRSPPIRTDWKRRAKRYRQAKRQIEERARDDAHSKQIFVSSAYLVRTPVAAWCEVMHRNPSPRLGRVASSVVAQDDNEKLRGRLRAPFRFDVKSCYFFLLFFFAFFLVAMFLFSLSIFHGCAALSKKPQLMNV